MKRTLTLKPGAAGLRLAIFSGSDLVVPTPEVLTYLRQTQADVFVILGGMGRSDAQAKETARALQSLSRLVLIVRGGADHFDASVFGQASLVLDASSLRGVRVGADTMIPWPGADQGRYTLNPQHCGFGQPDLDAALKELGARGPDERRWLLSWQAPEPGSALAAFGVRAGIAGALSAWPTSVPDEAEPTVWAPDRPRLVPRAWGPQLEAPEGRALPLGALVLQVDSDGPRVAR